MFTALIRSADRRRGDSAREETPTARIVRNIGRIPDGQGRPLHVVEDPAARRRGMTVLSQLE